jgi:ADP-heptose:LPS heptosyltransferase
MNHLGVKDINELDLIPSLKFNFSSNKNDSNIIGIHPFSGDSMRQLNLHNTANLCTDLINLGYEISIFSNKYEYDKFYKLFPNKVNWVSKIENSVINTINELNRCKDIICGDSFITHLCQALNIKCIAIYGPFSPSCRVSTYSNITVIDTNPDCRCFKHQLNKCPKGMIPSPCINIDNNILIKLIENQEYIMDNINVSDPIVNKYNWRDNV